jgi:hypothetical protein
MASFSNQAEASSVTKLVVPITGGSGSEPADKKQKKETQRRVQHVGVLGPFIKSKWSHIPITFSQEDLSWGLVLKCYELRTRQHKMLNIKALRLLNHYFPSDIINLRRRS